MVASNNISKEQFWGPGGTMFHISPSTNRESIREQGLVGYRAPQEVGLGDTPGVFVSDEPHPRPILFSEQFERYHGLTPEQFLSGMSVSYMGGEKIVHSTPEEYDEFKRSLGPKHVTAPYREHLEETLSAPTNIRPVILKYRSGSSEVGVGPSPLVIARNLRDFTNEMENSARPNDRTLYRGAQRPPSQDASNNMPISFSENRAAANAFARSNRGEVFKMQAGSVKGLRMEDYGVPSMTVGPRRVSEAEWLVDPQSIR